jgi:hypothetical protein
MSTCYRVLRRPPERQPFFGPRAYWRITAAVPSRQKIVGLLITSREGCLPKITLQKIQPVPWGRRTVSGLGI